MVSDNLPALAALPDACIDLIYLDPPFNSKKQYSNPINIPEEYAHTLYRDYTEMGVQVVEPAFSDEWSMELYLQDAAGDIYPNPNWKHQWVTAIAESYPALHSVLTSAGQAQDEGLQGYLTFMAVRLLQMRRVLKDTGSIYLHCDPTASHYLKAVMDCIFGRDNFRNEIVWCYSSTSQASRWYPRKHDTIYWYSKGSEWRFNADDIRIPYSKPLARHGKTWKSGSDAEREALTKRGKIPESWWQIPMLNSMAKERTGYPTQKPLALLNRIIAAASNPGDVVLDPFAGCATACVAAEQLGRRWLGIEIGEEGYRQVVQRMRDTVKIASKDTPLLLEPERVITRLEELPGQQTDYPLAPPEARKGGGRMATPPRVKVEDKTKEWLFGVQRGYCIGCAAALPLHIMAVDHAIPRAQGGPDEEWNYQLLCSYCNPVKGDRLTTQQLWAVNQESGVLTDIDRVRRLWKARARERRDKGSPDWPLN